KRHVWIAKVLDQVQRGHAEWIGLYLERSLIPVERFPCKCINLGDLFVGDGVAASRGAAAMHHDISAGSAVCAVVSIGIANVEREVVVRVGVHLPWPHGVEPFGSLAITFPDLRAELTRPAADRMSLE